MKLKNALIGALVIGMAVSTAHAQSVEQELTALKDKLAKQLLAKGRKKVAALDFTDLQGRRNELGRYLAEQLTVELVDAEGIAVLDRANLKSILDEHKLSEEGLVNPENAKKLGQFSGVDGIIIGNVSMTDKDIILLVKVISTETAEVVAAGRAKFPKTSEFQQSIAKAISPTVTTGQPAQSGGTGAGSVDASAIATKEIGPLRLTLRNVVPLNKADGVVGLVCTFDVTNLDLRKALMIATNSSPQLSCSKLADSNGHEWRLDESNGLPRIVCGYVDDPSSIVKIIKTGTQVNTPNDLVGADGNKWFGGFLTLEPGASKQISLTFRPLDTNGDVSRSPARAMDWFQLETQLVIGASDPGAEPRYELETVVFDKIIMAKRGGKP